MLQIPHNTIIAIKEATNYANALLPLIIPCPILNLEVNELDLQILSMIK
jgi:hypothetical protein